MQKKNAAVRTFCRGLLFLDHCRWVYHHSSTPSRAPSHTSNKGLLSSQLHSFSSVTDSFLPVTGKPLPHDVSEFFMEPIGTSQLRPVEFCCCKENDGLGVSEDGLNKLLNACIDTPSTASFEHLIASTTEIYTKYPSRHWFLHSRALANYGVQCLVDQKASQAIGLIRQAASIITSFEGETAVLHLRVVLANALACEGKCFEALCEYEEALGVMRNYPLESSLTQVVSGKESCVLLSRSYVLEDFDRFLANEEMVQSALNQGKQELESCSNKAEKVRITWILARLNRRIGEKDASLLLYTSSLRTLLDTPDVEMEIRVMHDIGLLLCFETFDVAQGLPYLQAAAEMSFDTALGKLEELRQQNSTTGRKNYSQNEMLPVRRAIFTLLDAAVCLAENEDLGKALGLFEESIALMNECGMHKHSAWARIKYADALTQASLIDKAIRVYLETMEIIQSMEHEDENLQVACMGMIVPVTVAEVEGRLAHCFQMHVGEYRRACIHFCLAIRRCGVHVRSPFTAFEEKHAFSLEEVDSETLCWMLENYASCCERVGRKDIAEEVLERRVSVEKALGGSCASALLRLAQLHGAENAAKAVELYIQLLTLPEDGIEPDVLLQSAYGFASVCYGSKDEELELALAKVTAMSCGGKKINSVGDVSCDGPVSQNPNGIVISSFKRSAKVIMASHAVEGTRSNGSSEDELKALMTLSRGGFFCQRRGDEAGAEELYSLAVEYTLMANVHNEEYARELAIMLANYATVMAHKDMQKAQELYNRAVEICPTEENVSAAAASFFVLTANYAAGRACIQRMIDAVTDRVVISRLYGKIAWLGVVCWDELALSVRQECLQHLLFALGLEPNNFFLTLTDCHVTPIGGFVSVEFKQDLLSGISSSPDPDTVSLACYVAQTKLPHDARFINTCYKTAVMRFSYSTTLLVNYAKFCADYGAGTLARKYYAAAFCYCHKDPRSNECYADYLAFLNRGEQQHVPLQQEQIVAGESLARYQVERSTCDMSRHVRGQTLTLYGKYLATFMPSPSVPALLFEEALRRNAADSRATALYGSFLWNVCVRALDANCTSDVKEKIAVKVETLYREGLRHQPQNVLLLTSLGAFYVSMGNRFDDAVCVLDQARKLSPHNVVVNRLLCAAFHEEWMEEEKRMTAKSNARLQSLLETTRQLYEVAVQLDPSDRLTLTRYCQFALHGLQNAALAAELMQRLRGLPKA
ncbi:hypothetical protein C3747_9g228 [Trypanosoma cruzi]|uniref:Uncharacterized protein n=1 Tax=Trypanosoma cruzi TaxID=5693 RepID=A0A2V2XFN9_TRYCR|nr:hypothetical protein C3747_9g228 [Trypanosoma cruzi]